MTPHGKHVSVMSHVLPSLSGKSYTHSPPNKVNHCELAVQHAGVVKLLCCSVCLREMLIASSASPGLLGLSQASAARSSRTSL